ncbi:MAG: holo-ACP synthase [Armatimonadota bacterium]|nr:holo-ACP synthase [Armatimonadota bacterium]
MQILGIGTDIVEIERIKDICRRLPGFEPRIFIQAELEYCRPKAGRYSHLAARFAAKEAVAKALGSSFSWHDVEIYSEPSGKPAVRLHGRAKEAAGNSRVFLSISHSRDYATAVAVLARVA